MDRYNDEIKVIDKQGRKLFISDGISNGKTWGVFYRKANGNMARLKSKYLPMCANINEAVVMLKRYAKKHNLPTI